MRKIITTLLLVSVLAVSPLYITGCVGPNQPRPTTQQRIETGLKIAGQIGTGIALTEHPEWRNGFEKAVQDLKIIESGDVVTIQHLLAIIQRLPVKELKSPNAILYIQSGILLLNEFGVPNELPLEQSANVKSAAKSLREGIEFGLLTVNP